MSPGVLRLLVPLAGLLCLTLGPAPAAAKTVVCIVGDNDQFANSAEGYYRQLYPAPPAHISVGGDSAALVACLAQLVAGDSLILVAHGGPGRFRWNGRNHPGFTGGRAANGTGVITVGPNRVYPIPLPNNFGAGGLDITATMVSCFSCTAPQGAKSTAESLREGIKAGNTVNCFAGEARVQMPTYRLTGGTVAQRNAANACLFNAAPNPGGTMSAQGRIRLWLGSFRPPGSGAATTSLSAAQNAITLANCPGAGGAVTASVSYGIAPFNQKGLGPLEPLAALTPLVDDYSEVDEEISLSDCETEQPTVARTTTWGGIKALIR